MRQQDILPLTGGALDRAAHFRNDAAALEEMRGAAQAGLFMAGAGGVLCRDGAPWRAPLEAAPEAAELIFLGLASGAPRFAAHLPEGAALPEGTELCDGRGLLGGLSPDDGASLAAALGVLSWHRSHGFCANCGAPSQMADAGWRRHCAACGRDHFPRTDPVVIMLVTDADRLLLGRAPGWPPGMFSLLAGFMEPGETLDAAVRREVLEETGIRCGPARYLDCQPWPFPSSLMLGCHCEALSTEISIDPTEIEAACWVDRTELARICAGQHPEIRPPRRAAIAGHLIRNWLADRL